jgi:ABC-type multidrug transport system fused ATPase/permease subunit
LRVFVENLNVKIAKGECVAIRSDKNEAGKSTALRLIARLKGLQSGQVLIDGVDIWVHPDVPKKHVVKVEKHLVTEIY